MHSEALSARKRPEQATAADEPREETLREAARPKRAA